MREELVKQLNLAEAKAANDTKHTSSNHMVRTGGMTAGQDLHDILSVAASMNSSEALRSAAACAQAAGSDRGTCGVHDVTQAYQTETAPKLGCSRLCGLSSRQTG
jgi:hypothetical protein